LDEEGERPVGLRPGRQSLRSAPLWGLVHRFAGTDHGVSAVGAGQGHTPYEVRFYESSTHLGGVPLFASGRAPVAIIAAGGRPLGVIALGGIPCGVIAVGGLAVGGLEIGGAWLGVIALAGLAIGWRAVGGGAIGYRAFGGVAVGGYAYAGNGVAYGYHEAGGRQKEKLIG
jgi:hypothetical protein